MDRQVADLAITQVRDAANIERLLPSLRRLLQSCVNDDPSASSLGFFAPLTDHQASDYWLQLLPSAMGPNPPTTLLVMTDPGGTDNDDRGGRPFLVGTVQIGRIPKATHSHRGEIRKLLIHHACRGRGIGRRLMEAAEDVARRDLGLEVLVLDTAKRTPARDFYLSTGWREWGVCPIYAMAADGTKDDCSFFVKTLR